MSSLICYLFVKVSAVSASYLFAISKELNCWEIANITEWGSVLKQYMNYGEIIQTA